jgi:hypothetical protein
VSDCTISRTLVAEDSTTSGYFWEILFPQTADISGLIFQWNGAAPCFGNIHCTAFDMWFSDWGIGRGALIS